jgi:hypothetical protein
VRIGSGAKQTATDANGVVEIDQGVFLEVIEKESWKKHTHFRGSLPHSNGIEEGFVGGPVYVVYAEDGYVDIPSGLTLYGGHVIRQTTVTSKLASQYVFPRSDQLAAAAVEDSDRITLPLASQRMDNYCRWWMDSVAKLFVCTNSQVFRNNLRAGSLRALVPDLGRAFQRQTIDLLGRPPLVSYEAKNTLIHGRSINSPGLTFAGGQRVGQLVCGFSEYLDTLLPTNDEASGNGTGELLYVSRNESTMRRLLNEQDLLPAIQAKCSCRSRRAWSRSNKHSFLPAGNNTDRNLSGGRSSWFGVFADREPPWVRLLFCRRSKGG